MNKVKYPRTYHLPYSEKSSSDDKTMQTDSHFIGKEVVVPIKMDGENTTIYSKYSHARSLNSDIDSEDRRWIEALRVSKIEDRISDNMRICGENVFYKHTCEYKNLKSFFLVFGIYIDTLCLSWDDTVKLCSELGLKKVPIIYRGIYDKDMILSCFNEYKKKSEFGDTEGFVVRLASSFEVEDFPTSLNKFVSKDFVIPNQHWRHSAKVQNKLANNQTAWNIL